ncbi:MAG: RnfABCDGE type electron transport complex subunit B [Eubacteriales bacterium]
MTGIIWAVVWFSAIALVFGVILALASKVFYVKYDERIDLVSQALPGANCGGCGYPGCGALSEAIVSGKAPVGACPVGGEQSAKLISDIMGVESAPPVRMRAQVLCSGTRELARLKYKYSGVDDCASAAKLAGGDKVCQYGCLGLGSCAKVCNFDAIHIINGVAAVDYNKCKACGRCVETCPKSVIKLIPYDSAHWIGCMSQDKGAVTRSYCDVGCIGCRMCLKACEFGAIKINGSLAEIDYDKCTGCGKCEQVCPRRVIWSGKSQTKDGIVREKDDIPPSDVQPG